MLPFPGVARRVAAPHAEGADGPDHAEDTFFPVRVKDGLGILGLRVDWGPGRGMPPRSCALFMVCFPVGPVLNRPYWGRLKTGPQSIDPTPHRLKYRPSGT